MHSHNTESPKHLSEPKTLLATNEVRWINFDPFMGGEIQKQRPSVIVNNDATNQFLNSVQVVPLTRNFSKLYPSESYVTFHREKAKAMADQPGGNSFIVIFYHIQGLCHCICLKNSPHGCQSIWPVAFRWTFLRFGSHSADTFSLTCWKHGKLNQHTHPGFSQPK